MLIDTHSHLNFAAYKDDADEVIRRALDNDVWMLNVGSNYETSKQAVEIAEKYEKGVYPHTYFGQELKAPKTHQSKIGVGVYAAVGVHPINIIQNSKCKMQNDNSKCKINENILERDFDYKKYKSLAGSKKVVAIGEIGLDYWDKPKTKARMELFKQKQKEIFLKQFALARELNLPVSFHCRLAHNDLLEILRFQVSGFKFQGVVHCFTGTWQQAEKYLALGLYLGFNGIIFKLNLDEVIKKAPLERILIETDCPFLIPPLARRSPQEGGPVNERNEPLYVRYIAQKIAETKKESLERIAEITTQNARGLFNLN